MENNKLTNIRKFIIILLSLIISSILITFFTDVVLKNPIDPAVGFLGQLIGSLIFFPIHAVVLLLIFNIAVKIGYLKSFKNDIKYISLSSIIYVLSFFALFDFNHMFIPHMWRNTFISYIIAYGAQAIEYILILFLLALMFKIFSKKQK